MMVDVWSNPDFGDADHAGWHRALLEVLLTNEPARADWRRRMVETFGQELSDAEAIEATRGEQRRFERDGIWRPGLPISDE